MGRHKNLTGIKEVRNRTCSERNTWSVYVHTNKINNKKYVGITSQVKVAHRWKLDGRGYESQPVFYGAILKYGWDNFDHEIIKSNLSEKEAKELEVQLIKDLNTYVNGGWGYNVTLGGDANYTISKPVLQFDLKGNCVAKYDSCNDAAKILDGNICSVRCNCCGFTLTYKNHFFAYENDENRLKQIDDLIDDPRIIYMYDSLYRPVYQFYISYNERYLVAEYENAKEAFNNLPTYDNGARKDIDTNEIVMCCKNEYYRTCGYNWKFKDEVSDIDEYLCNYNLHKANHRNVKEVVQIDSNTGEYMKIYSSYHEASDFMGNKEPSSIRKACVNKSSNSAGYIWKFADQCDPTELEKLRNKAKEERIICRERSDYIMRVNINTELTSTKNANGVRNASDIKYLVLHYTANPGSTEYNNCLYYATADLNGVSAHYFVGEKIYRCVPDLNIAGHCAKWKNTEYLTNCRNGNSLSIEQMVKSMSGKTAIELSGMENDLYFEPMTFVNTVKLSKELIKKYNIPITNVIRHYDVFSAPMRVYDMTAHKLCPRFMIGDDINIYFNRTGNSIWKEFLDNVKSTSDIISVPAKDGITLYYNIETDTWVDDPTAKPLDPSYRPWSAEVTNITPDDYLNVRTGAGTNYQNLPSYPRLALGNRVDVVSEIVSETDNRIWYQIRIANKYYGYVRSDYLKPLTPIKIAKVTKVNKLIVRSKPVVKQSSVYHNYPALGLNNYVEVLDESDRFFDRIRLQDQQGNYHIAYASRYYLERV